MNNSFPPDILPEDFIVKLVQENIPGFETSKISDPAGQFLKEITLQLFSDLTDTAADLALNNDSNSIEIGDVINAKSIIFHENENTIGQPQPDSDVNENKPSPDHEERMKLVQQFLDHQ